MKTETVEEFLKRGGQIKKVTSKDYDKEKRIEFTMKDRIDVAYSKTIRRGSNGMFDRFCKGFLEKGNTSWRFGK